MNKYNYKQSIKTQHLHPTYTIEQQPLFIIQTPLKSTFYQHHKQQPPQQTLINQLYPKIVISRYVKQKSKDKDNEIEMETKSRIIQRRKYGEYNLSNLNNREIIYENDVKIEQNKFNNSDQLKKNQKEYNQMLNQMPFSTFSTKKSQDTSSRNNNKQNMKIINKIVSNLKDIISNQRQTNLTNDKSFISNKIKNQIHSKAIKRQISLASATNIRHNLDKSRLKPICQTQNQIIQKKQLKLVANMNDRMRSKFLSLKNQKIIRQVTKIHDKNYNSIKYKIGNSFEYCHLENQEVYQNMFKIQSIAPEVNYYQKSSVNCHENHRKNNRNRKKVQQQQLQIQRQNEEDQNIKEFKTNNIVIKHHQIKKSINDDKSPNNKILIEGGEVDIKTVKMKEKVTLSRKIRKFNIPFETYYYRDFLWRLNYSNSLLVEPPLEYQHRLKVYIGKGNNSSLVRALVSRRYWLATVQKPEDANFVWTQLKQLNYFKLQKQCKQSLKQCKLKTYTKTYLNTDDITEIQTYLDTNLKPQEYCDERFIPRHKYFDYSTHIKPQSIKNSKMQNHLINNYVICNKKALYKTLTSYYLSQNIDPFNFIPITFHIKSGIQDEKFLQFQRYYHYRKRQIKRNNQDNNNLWIIKPGQNSNRGFGIKLCLNLQQIKSIVKLKQKWSDGTDKTYIIQSYIQNPLLYQRRKFDFRHYILITCINGHLKGYWYEQGYVRTSSAQFNMKDSDSSIHLTNDVIQKYLPNYGKYQKGNKLSYEQINQYIFKKYKKKSFYDDIYPNMKNIAIDVMKASAYYLDPDKLSNNFELFGLDFMVDANLKVWLIEVNSNPCLELSCPILSMIIPNLIENVLEMTLDVMFPPAIRYCAKIPRYSSKIQEFNKFQLIFDERIEQNLMNNISCDILDVNLLKEQDDFYEDDGSQWDQNI